MRGVGLIFLMLCGLCSIAQVYSFDYNQIEQENKKSKLHIDTLKCDTTITYRKEYRCALQQFDKKDAVISSDSGVDYTTVICQPPLRAGLNLIYHHNDSRYFLGFVTIRHIFSKKFPFIKKRYVTKGLCVYYEDGRYGRFELSKPIGKNRSFITFHENGNVYIIRISNGRNVYTEIYDEEENQMITKEEMQALEDRLSMKPTD